MKSKTKQISIAGLSAVCALSISAGIGLAIGVNGSTAYAEDSVKPSAVYYYDNLTDAQGNEYTLAKKFYDILDAMNKSGDFKDGIIDYTLDGIVTSAEIKAWVEDGNLTIPKAFSAARDSFYYDHPELFYVDLYKLTISAGRTNGVYSAFIDCGREANCYIDGGFSSQEEVETAIVAYDAKIDEMVSYARTEAAKDTYGTAEDVLLATYANVYIAEHVEYDMDSYTQFIESDGDANPATYAYSAYGSVVLGKSVCSGYARAYKAVMDKLGVPCVIVSGYSIKKSGDGASSENGVAHSWNYVYLETPSEDGIETQSEEAEVKEGRWYAFDVTWNSTGASTSSYVTMNAFTTSRSHATDPVVSSSGYIMPYPSLSQNNYGNTTEYDEFRHSYVYSPDTTGDNKYDDFGNLKMVKNELVSYKGQGALALMEEGLYIVYRAYYEYNGAFQWTNWTNVANSYIACDVAVPDDGTEISVPNAYNALYTQYAVVDVNANLNLFGEPVKENDNSGYGIAVSYSADYVAPDGKDLGEHTLFISEIYTNKTYGTYTPAPYVKKTAPAHTDVVTISDSMAIDGTALMQDSKAFTMKVTYDEELHILDTSKPIGISFITEFNNIYQYADFVKLDSGNYVDLSEDGTTLTFKFKPSLMYEHNSIIYSFYFDNIGSTKVINGRTSNKAPNPVHYHFARAYTVCPQILGGGKLWIDCCAQPTLVSNSDLSAMNFIDEDGNSTFSEQARSQMMLVAETASPETEQTMLNEISKEFGVKEKNVKASETYDINLQICGKYPKIADGSYVKIALGFPEGYGPEDEGVTFKLYHRKHISGDKYIIEEVPCVVTQMGIIATVTSFSPYMVAAVDASKVSSDKTIYATIDGNGGKLSLADGQVQSIKKGGSYTYSITPDAGYKVYKVTLNGVDVTADVGADGKFTVTYDNLINNNELVIQYISEAAAQRYESKEIEVVDPVKVIVSTEGESSIALRGDQLPMNLLVAKSDSTVWIVLGCVLGVIVIGCAVATGVLFYKKKKAED